MGRLSEFELIAKYFAPLSEGGKIATGTSYGLKDDAAVLSCRPGEEWVVTKDAIVEGVHFLPNDPPDTVARKLLRVNLSDLAAKGAQPAHYLLFAAWPVGANEDWVAEFARGLGEDQSALGVRLLGGDTVSTKGPATFSLTAFGTVQQGGMIRRSGARVGDDVYVSGTIGDAFLGLKVLRGELILPEEEDRSFFISRYRIPQPRVDLVDVLQSVATAAIDVSDGLCADINHLGTASGVGMRLDLDAIPVSAAADRVVSSGRINRAALAVGGDDYEVAFTASPDAALPAGMTKIGTVVQQNGLWSGADNGPLNPLDPAGFSHF